jgi:NADPH:quinone reductase-like Zn-dependent oxidoreductase
VGTFAVQIAKAFGTHVTAATSTQHLEMVRSIGADRVFDYTREDFTRDGQRYDLICDVGGNRSLSDLGRVMTPEGRLVVVGIGAGAGRWLGPLLRPLGAAVRSRFGRRRMLPFLSHPNTEDLLVLTDLIEAGKVTPVIDRTYPLSGATEAIRYVETGRARGKVVITL